MSGILLDADINPAVADAPSQLGQNSVAASGTPALEALDDVELLREATRQSRVLATFNIIDFIEAARQFAQRAEDHAGIILIHSRSYKQTDVGPIARALDALLRSRADFVNAVLFLQ
ncbi:MAG TPA: DUF5615 family PIN-like protein [bacterium]